MDDVFRCSVLNGEADWASLTTELGGDRPNHPLLSLLYYLRHRAGANQVVREGYYVDRDHRSAYSHFYSKQFRHTERLCTRYHFFRTQAAWTELPFTKGAIEPDYLGYIIQRPLQSAPVGRSVVTSGMIPGARVTCAANYTPHLDSWELEVEGVPFCQQDTAVMSCAETAIWTASRVMTKHFRHRLVLPSDIATPQTIGFSELGRVMPSGGMTGRQIAHSLVSLGFAPLVYDKEVASEAWDVVNLAGPYLLSGIPVICGVQCGGGHAVTACGLVSRGEEVVRPDGDVRSTLDFVDAVVVHDDALGPYRLMPRTDGVLSELQRDGYEDLLNTGDSATWWQTCSNADVLVVPSPEKLFLSAPFAAEAARGLIADREAGLFQQARDLLMLLGRHGNQDAKLLLDAALEGDDGGLVYSLRCRKSVDVRKSVAEGHEVVRGSLRNTPMPRYVWAVEITSYGLYRRDRREDRKLLGELYLDTTAHVAEEAALVFGHCIGFLIRRPDRASSNNDAVLLPIPNDQAFYRADIPLWTDEK